MIAGDYSGHHSSGSSPLRIRPQPTCFQGDLRVQSGTSRLIPHEIGQCAQAIRSTELLKYAFEFRNRYSRFWLGFDLHHEPS